MHWTWVSTNISCHPLCMVNCSTFKKILLSCDIVRIPLLHQMFNLFVSTHIDYLLTWLVSFISTNISTRIIIKFSRYASHHWQIFCTGKCLNLLLILIEHVFIFLSDFKNLWIIALINILCKFVRSYRSIKLEIIVDLTVNITYHFIVQIIIIE